MKKAVTIFHPTTGTYQRAVKNGDVYTFSDGTDVPVVDAIEASPETKSKMEAAYQLKVSWKEKLRNLFE